MRLAILLYQSGIANVFAVDRFMGDLKPVRLMQGTFRSCEDFTRGLQAAGITVTTMSANVAGDATLQVSKWRDGLNDCPFRDSANPPNCTLSPAKWPSQEYSANGDIVLRNGELDGKRIVYTNTTEFIIEVGKGRSAYTVRNVITGNLTQAVHLYNSINIGNGYKKRLRMPASSRNPILAKQTS